MYWTGDQLEETCTLDQERTFRPKCFYQTQNIQSLAVIETNINVSQNDFKKEYCVIDCPKAESVCFICIRSISDELKIV